LVAATGCHWSSNDKRRARLKVTYVRKRETRQKGSEKARRERRQAPEAAEAAEEAQGRCRRGAGARGRVLRAAAPRSAAAADRQVSRADRAGPDAEVRLQEPTGRPAPREDRD